MRTLFKEEYCRDMDRLGPDEGEMARLLSALEEGERRPAKGHLGRRLLVAALLAAALCTTALAASPTLRQALSEALGSFEPYSQKVEGVAVEDQGIRVELVAILADKDGGRAFFQVTDLEGGRLALPMGIEVNEHNMLLMPVAWAPEEESVLCMAYLTDYTIDLEGDRETCIDLAGFGPGYTQLPAFDLPWEAVTTETLASQVVRVEKESGGCWSGVSQKNPETGEPVEDWFRSASSLGAGEYRVLAPGQTPAELGNQWISLSSMGFDEEGIFHIQYKLEGGARFYGALKAFWPHEIQWPEGVERYLEQAIPLEDGEYVDFRYPDVTPELLGQFRLSRWSGVVYTKPPIIGNWRLEFQVPSTPVRELKDETGANRFDGVILEELTLSVEGLCLNYRLEELGGADLGSCDATLYLTDGSAVRLGPRVSRTNLWQDAGGAVFPADRWTQAGEGDLLYGGEYYFFYEEAIEPERVAGVAVNGWYIPIKGESIGPGYRLQE